MCAAVCAYVCVFWEGGWVGKWVCVLMHLRMCLTTERDLYLLRSLSCSRDLFTNVLRALKPNVSLRNNF